jgi:NAD+ synthase (glutamine-hydrolysing)
MRIALAQLNFTINHFEQNRSKIVDAIERAKSKGADLVVFSELAVCGYPPRDLLEQEEFIQKCYSSINAIATSCKGITAVVGAPSLNPNPKGKMLYNSAFVLQNGGVRSIHGKTLLPDYDIFDEYRYFEPAGDHFEIVEVAGKRLAVTVCEDLWDDQPTGEVNFRRHNLYRSSPMEHLAELKPDMIVNIAASPFSYNIEQQRLQVFQGNIVRYGLPVVYVNQVGGNAELLFDGGSMVLDANGAVVCRLASFTEDFRVVSSDDFKHSSKSPEYTVENQENRIARIHDALVMGIRDYFRKMGFSHATLGLSGGIDSAVVLALAQQALGADAIRVLLLPSQYSSKHSVDDAVTLATRMGIQYDTIGIQPIFDSFKNQLADLFQGLPEGIAEENIQARVRGTLLMAISNKFGHLLLNTTNKSEAAVGYGTLYGDMNGAIGVLGDVYKTDVYNLASYINRNQEVIPPSIISKPPSAELRPNQKDTDSLPPYEVLDRILFAYIEQNFSEGDIVGMGFDSALVHRVIRMVSTSEYKRFQAPPILRVSSKAFGYGRRMPLVSLWP